MKMQQAEAERVAREIMMHVPEIRSIDIFGSIARKGRGNDIDMFFVVSDKLCKKWLEATHFSIRPRTFFTVLFYYAKKYIPFFEHIVSHKKWKYGKKELQSVLDYDFDTMTRDVLGRTIRLDIVLVPDGWLLHGTVNRERLATDFKLSEGTIDFLEYNAHPIIHIDRANV